MPRRALLFPVVIGSIVFAAWSQYALRAQDAAEASHGKHDPKTGLGLPPGWPEGHPVPQVQSNCMKCHLTAGRELSAAVLNFSHSVHDLNQLSCHDCHGGNTEDDAACARRRSRLHRHQAQRALEEVSGVSRSRSRDRG